MSFSKRCEHEKHKYFFYVISGMSEAWFPMGLRRTYLYLHCNDPNFSVIFIMTSFIP